MSLLQNIQHDNTVQDSGDRLGGATQRDSGVYDDTIQLAYLQAAASGAIGLHLTLKSSTGIETKTALYITSGTEKGGQSYYLDKEGNKKMLAGYETARHIAKLTCNKEINQLATEQKLIPLYNATAGAEVPTMVEVVMDLLGKQLKTGFIKRIENKNVKDASGKYQPTNEQRENSELSKVFNSAGFTLTEVEAGSVEPAFIKKWIEKWEGKTDNRFKQVAGMPGVPGGGSTGSLNASAPAAAPRPNLFG